MKWSLTNKRQQHPLLTLHAHAFNWWRQPLEVLLHRAPLRCDAVWSYVQTWCRLLLLMWSAQIWLKMMMSGVIHSVLVQSRYCPLCIAAARCVAAINIAIYDSPLNHYNYSWCSLREELSHGRCVCCLVGWRQSVFLNCHSSVVVTVHLRCCK